MTLIVTALDVFELMDSSSDVQTNHQEQIESIIRDVQGEVERKYDRAVFEQLILEEFFDSGMRCDIIGDRIQFYGKYRDWWEITEVVELGDILTASTSYDDEYDYYFDKYSRELVRKGTTWTKEQQGIRINGKLGMVGNFSDGKFELDDRSGFVLLNDGSGYWELNEPELTTLKAVQSLVKQVAAVRSGLWTRQVLTTEGPISVARHSSEKHIWEQFDYLRLQNA